MFLAGNALKDAVAKMVDRMKSAAKILLRREVQSLMLSEEHIITDTGERLDYRVVARVLEESGLGREVVGEFEVPRVDPIPGSLEIPHLFYMFGVALAAVEVNTLTGAVNVTHIVNIADVGKVVNPQTLTGQLEGAAAQAAGYALFEDAKIEDGFLKTTNLSTYLIPSIKDVGVIEAVPVEDYEEAGPLGAKGIGEIGFIPVAPAIANAVYNAVGVRPLTLPMTPERVYWLIKRRI
jgi:CO/xanthine dehydrogenase Mo-binding subunit